MFDAQVITFIVAVTLLTMAPGSDTMLVFPVPPLPLIITRSFIS